MASCMANKSILLRFCVFENYNKRKISLKKRERGTSGKSGISPSESSTVDTCDIDQRQVIVATLAPIRRAGEQLVRAFTLSQFTCLVIVLPDRAVFHA